METISAPWWGVPVVAGTFLIVGAVVGFLFNWLTDSRRAKREDRLRNLADVKATSLKVAEILRQLSGLYRFRFSHQQIAFGGNYSAQAVASAKKTISETDQEIFELVVALELAEVKLRVFAPPPVYLAASEILHSAGALELPIKVRESLNAFDEGVENYISIVRDILGVDRK